MLLLFYCKGIPDAGKNFDASHAFPEWVFYVIVCVAAYIAIRVWIAIKKDEEEKDNDSGT